jgi:AcrR family transcriptional regulator
MARPPTNHQAKKAEIIAAAFKSFSTYGYEGTSNTKIAAEGGFSPTLIYHYFPNKTALFMACVEDFQPLKNLGDAVRAAADEPPDIYLRKLALTYLEITEDENTIRILRMIITEVSRFPELAQVFPERVAPLIFYPVVEYFMKQAAAGRLEMKHPIAMIMTFYGPLLVKALFGPVLSQTRLPFTLPTNDEMVETVIQSFLHGLTSENKNKLKEKSQE